MAAKGKDVDSLFASINFVVHRRRRSQHILSFDAN